MTESRRVHAVCKHTRGSARSTLDEEPAELTHPARSAEAADATYERLPRSRACRRRTRACGARRSHGRSQPAISVRQPLWVKRTRTRRGGDEGGARAAAGISHHGHGREKKGVRAVPSAQWSAPRSMERSPLKPVPENPLFHPQEPTLSFATRKKHHQPPTLSCLQLR